MARFEELASLNIKLIGHFQNPKRDQEFSFGRYCLQEAAKLQGIALPNIPKAEKGEPKLPAGVSASLSHKKGFYIAAVSNSLVSVGIDVEKILKKEKALKLKPLFINASEDKVFGEKPVKITIIFSAKESLYKLLFPLVKTFFGFSEASIIEITNDQFKIELHSKIPELIPYNKVYEGNFKELNGYIITYLELNEDVLER